MKSAGKARNNGLYRHIRTSKEIIRNLLNDSLKCSDSTRTAYTKCAEYHKSPGDCTACSSTFHTAAKITAKTFCL